MTSDLWIVVVKSDRPEDLEKTVSSLTPCPSFQFRVVVVENTPAGRLYAYNSGLSACLGGWVTFLTAGQCWSSSPNFDWQANPEIDIWMGGRQWVDGENSMPVYRAEAMVFRQELFDLLGPFNPLLEPQAEATWLVQAQQIGLRLAPVATPWLVLPRTPHAGPSDKEWNELNLASSRPDYHETYLQLPGAILRLRVEDPELFRAWCEIWHPYEEAPQSAQLEATVYAGVEKKWEIGCRAGLVDPWLAAQGLRSLWGDSPLVWQRPALQAMYAWKGDSPRIIANLCRSADLTATDKGKPLQILIMHYLEQLGWHIFHASVVAHRGRGVLLIGSENAGKSSLMAACLESGWDFVADDLVALRLQGDKVEAYGLYAGCWLSKTELRLFPRFTEAQVLSPLDPKVLIPLIRVLPRERLLRKTHLQIVACPAVANPHSPTATGVCARPHALRLMLASTLHKLPGKAWAEKFQVAVESLQRLPCYHLPLTQDRFQAVQSLENLLW